MEKKMKINRILIVIMFILGLTGIVLLSYNYIISKVNLTFETVNLSLYGNQMPEEKNETEENQTEPETTPSEPETTKTPQTSTDNYSAYLEIEKINLKQGFYYIGHPNNKVDKGIQVINPSDWPDVDGGNLILAAHSGTASISYFKNLWQLSNNDTVSVFYNNNKYTYQIVNIYTVPKNGQVAIYRDTNKTCITLITCTKDSDTLQTVYIGELISKEGI